MCIAYSLVCEVWDRQPNIISLFQRMGAHHCTLCQVWRGDAPTAVLIVISIPATKQKLWHCTIFLMFTPKWNYMYLNPKLAKKMSQWWLFSFYYFYASEDMLSFRISYIIIDTGLPSCYWSKIVSQKQSENHPCLCLIILAANASLVLWTWC